MDINEVREFLRIDEDEDEKILLAIMNAAEFYIKDSVGFFDPENEKMKILYWLVIQDFYENRVLVVKEADKQRLSYVCSTLILQLQTDALLKEGESNG